MQDDRYNGTARAQMDDILINASKNMSAPALTDADGEIPNKGNRLIRLSDVGDLDTRWLWEPYIQLGNITILRGIPGSGKTYFVSALMGAVASREQPYGMPMVLRKTNSTCIYYGIEEDPETIRARVKSACDLGTCDLDKQGRINISSPLINYADLTKECVVIGVGERLEVWSLDRWNKLTTENEDSFSEIADSLFSQNII